MTERPNRPEPSSITTPLQRERRRRSCRQIVAAGVANPVGAAADTLTVRASNDATSVIATSPLRLVATTGSGPRRVHPTGLTPSDPNYLTCRVLGAQSAGYRPRLSRRR